MTAHILPFPGIACAYYRQGRCLKEEIRNPGLHVTYRCGILQKTSRALDAFLDRAEAFSLSEKEAAHMWQQREGRLLLAPCPLRNAPPGPPYECSHFQDDLCTLLLPLCAGVCQAFMPAAPSPLS